MKGAIHEDLLILEQTNLGLQSASSIRTKENEIERITLLFSSPNSDRIEVSICNGDYIYLSEGE